MNTPVIGTKERPYLRKPVDFSADGIPWGAYCKCSRCGYVGRSTVSFDYFSDDNGALACEHCKYGSSYALDKMMCLEIESGRVECDPLGPGCRGGYDESLG